MAFNGASSQDSERSAMYLLVLCRAQRGKQGSMPRMLQCRGSSARNNLSPATGGGRGRQGGEMMSRAFCAGCCDVGAIRRIIINPRSRRLGNKGRGNRLGCELMLFCVSSLSGCENKGCCWRTTKETRKKHDIYSGK